LLLTVWVVGVRGVLQDRALMDRWVGEVLATMRSSADETIARRMLDAEIAFTRQLATHNRRPGLTQNHGKRRNSASESFL
jgi:ABC-type histidine transport system ATPase subunit